MCPDYLGSVGFDREHPCRNILPVHLVLVWKLGWHELGCLSLLALLEMLWKLPNTLLLLEALLMTEHIAN